MIQETNGNLLRRYGEQVTLLGRSPRKLVVFLSRAILKYGLGQLSEMDYFRK